MLGANHYKSNYLNKSLKLTMKKTWNIFPEWKEVFKNGDILDFENLSDIITYILYGTLFNLIIVLHMCCSVYSEGRDRLNTNSYEVSSTLGAIYYKPIWHSEQLSLERQTKQIFPLSESVSIMWSSTLGAIYYQAYLYHQT